MNSTRVSSARDRGRLLASVSIATFLLMLDLTVVNVAIGSIATSLSAELLGLQSVINVYALALALFVLLSGVLGDRFGRDRVFKLGLGLFIGASLLCGLAPSIGVLVSARAIQGVAAAAMFATGPALIAAAYTKDRQGMAFGIFGAAAGSAIAFGPLVGGLLVEVSSWRLVFLVNVPLGAIAAWMFTRNRIVANSTSPPRPIHLRSLPPFIVTSIATVGYLSFGAHVEFVAPQALALAAIGALGLVAFVLSERREGQNALIPPQLLKNSAVTRLNFATLLNGSTVLASLFLLTAFVQQTWGMSAMEVGVRFLPLTMAVVVGALLAGYLARVLSNTTILGVSLLILGAGIGTVPFLAESPDSLDRLLPSMIAIGLGMGLFNPPRAALAVSLVSDNLAATSTGINETAQQLGAAIGVAIFGALYASTATNGPEDLQLPLVTAAVVAMVGGAVSLTGRRH